MNDLEARELARQISLFGDNGLTALESAKLASSAARAPGPVTLRPYQVSAVESFLAAIARGKRRLLVNLPTGTGKTVYGFALAKRLGHRVCWLAHRDELLRQPLETAARVWPEVSRGLVKASQNEGAAHVVVASVQTLGRPGRLEQLNGVGEFGLVVVDECHHVASDQYHRVLEGLGCFREGGPPTLGLTATLERADGIGLGAVFEEIAYQLGLHEAIDKGYLSPFRGVQVELPLRADVRALVETLIGRRAKRPRGYEEEDDQEDETPDAESEKAKAERAILFQGVAEATAHAVLEHASDRKTIVFTCTIDQARRTADELTKLGMRAEHASGEMPLRDRQAVLERFKSGATRVVCNASLLVEGFDEPSVDCIVVAKPTRSRSVYCLDTETEILTRSGWRRHNTLNTDELVAGFDPATGKVTWTNVLGFVRRPLEPGERFIAYQSKALDFRVTEKHRMLVRPRRGRGAWRFQEAREVLERSSEFRMPVAGVQDGPGAQLSDHEVRFLGWFLSDGTLNKRNRQVTIYQSVNSKYHDSIRACLDGCGFKYGIHVHRRARTNLDAASDMVRYTVSKGAPRGRDRHLTGWARLDPFMDKHLSRAYEDLDARQVGLLLETLNFGDGSKHGLKHGWRGVHITTGSLPFAERLQSLLVRRGYRCNVARDVGAFSWRYTVHVHPDSDRVVGGAAMKDRPNLRIDEGRPGERVWCVETGTGTIFTRRNGKVLVMGNCQAVGRGLRLYPGKRDCLVLDVVFASDLGLQTAATLANTEATTLFTGGGRTLSDRDPEEREAEEEKRVLATAAASLGEGVAMDGRQNRVEGPRWLSVNPTCWALSLWPQGVLVVDRLPLEENPDGSLFEAFVMPPKGASQRVSEPGAFEWVFGVAEDFMRSSAGHALAGSPKWRRAPVSQGQLAELARRGLPMVRTAGDAADQLTVSTVRARLGY